MSAARTAASGAALPGRSEIPCEIRCAAPECTATVVRSGGRGRPALYCSPACRAAASRRHRRHRHQPLAVEVDHGSTSARGRPSGRVWLVRLRRGEQAVVLATGLGRPSADYLAHQIDQLLHPAPVTRGGRIR